MKMNIYSVYDKKAEAFMQPFYSTADGSAARSFMSAVADDKHQFCQYPEDYIMFRLGVFDDQTALLEMEESPRQITTGLDARRMLKAMHTNGE